MMGKYCYAVIHEDGHAWYWGDDAVDVKRISVHGLPDAVKITRMNGSASTFTIGPKTKYFAITNAQRIRGNLSLHQWIKKAEDAWRLYFPRQML